MVAFGVFVIEYKSHGGVVDDVDAFFHIPFISPNVSKVLLASGVAGILLTTATFLPVGLPSL